MIIMPISAIITLSVSVGLMILSLIFKIAGKLRLGIPLIYFLAAVVSTFFTDWTTKNEQLVLIGLYVLISLVVISWIYSLIKTIRQKFDDRKSENTLADYIAWQLEKAKENGIDKSAVTFDADGHMRYLATGEQIIF